MPNIYTDRQGNTFENTTVLIPIGQKQYAREHGLSLSHVLRRAMSEMMTAEAES